eukprot:TRINITY_DN3936_c0_g1_i3.p1 TRINITY_DN3936_c0_g1~~TRINITY_DN3936_c0_g1_i3.p1  ORF type:complete len:323 (+),score=103.19 TRINITY_DN3936_c0_g1_i3:412-1380(+)
MTVVALDAKGIGPGGGGDMLAWGQVVVRPKEFFRDRDHTVDVELRKPLADHKIEKFSANGTITSKDPPPIEVMPKPKADHPIEGAGKARMTINKKVKVGRKTLTLKQGDIVEVLDVKSKNGVPWADVKTKAGVAKVLVTMKGSGRTVLVDVAKKGASKVADRRKRMQHRLGYREDCWLHAQKRLAERKGVVEDFLNAANSHQATNRRVKAADAMAQMPPSGLTLKFRLRNEGELQDLPDFAVPVPDDALLEDLEEDLKKLEEENAVSLSALAAPLGTDPLGLGREVESVVHTPVDTPAVLAPPDPRLLGGAGKAAQRVFSDL